MTPATLRIIANGVLFQLGWFACLLGGDGYGLLATLLLLLIHGQFVVSQQREWLGIACIVLIGLLVDNILARFMVFQFQSPLLWNIPVWLVCIWALFASTLLHSLHWLKNHVGLSMALGAVAAPASYFAGSKMASVIMLEPVYYSLLPIALSWAILMPLFYRIMGWFVDEN